MLVGPGFMSVTSVDVYRQDCMVATCADVYNYVGVTVQKQESLQFFMCDY